MMGIRADSPWNIPLITSHSSCLLPLACRTFTRTAFGDIKNIGKRKSGVKRHLSAHVTSRTSREKFLRRDIGENKEMPLCDDIGIIYCMSHLAITIFNSI